MALVMQLGVPLEPCALKIETRDPRYQAAALHA